MNARAVPVVLGPDEIRRRLAPVAAVTAVRDAYVALATGGADQPPPAHIQLASGALHVKSALLASRALAAVKIYSGFAGDPQLGVPPNDGLIVAVDATTGRIRAVLLDGSWLTDVRTAAGAAVAVQALRGDGPAVVCVMGTGALAHATLSLMSATGMLAPGSRLWGRDPAKARRLAAVLATEGVDVVPVADPQDAVGAADVTVTVTSATEPVVRGAWLRPEAVVVAVGAGMVGRRELDAEVFSRARAVVTDRLADSRLVGELQYALAEGTSAEAVIELGDLLAGRAQVPHTGIRVCDMVGIGVLDVAIADAVLAATAKPTGPAVWSR